MPLAAGPNAIGGMTHKAGIEAAEICVARIVAVGSAAVEGNDEPDLHHIERLLALLAPPTATASIRRFGSLASQPP
jgi:hypothetical protein